MPERRASQSLGECLCVSLKGHVAMVARKLFRKQLIKTFSNIAHRMLFFKAFSSRCKRDLFLSSTGTWCLDLHCLINERDYRMLETILLT